MSYGPTNPHPLSQMKTELVWEGKYDEYGNRREVDIAGAAMPLQKIETVDEPRSRAQAEGDQATLFNLEQDRKKLGDFRNMLVWGENKLVMASLLKEFKGKVDLVYIDPPFDVGEDFTLGVPIGDEDDSVPKDQSTLEMVAYRDVWGRGMDSYLHWLSESLVLLRELMAERASLYVHLDWRMVHYVRAMLDDILGRERFLNQVVWKRTNARKSDDQWPRIHDVILMYSKGEAPYFDPQSAPGDPDKLPHTLITGKDGRKYPTYELTAPGVTEAGESGRPWRGFDVTRMGRHWAHSHSRMDAWDASAEIHWPKGGGFPRRISKEPFNEAARTVAIGDVWTEIDRINQAAMERTNYPTQKPEALLERIVRASSREGDLVLDCFAGSGTSGAVAERLSRRWIMCDLGRFAIHTSRKRLIEVQRQLHAEGKPYRAFDVYNLGRYERQWWQRERLQGADEEHRMVVLAFYHADPLLNSPSPLLHGRKGPALIHVDSIDGIFTRSEVRAVADAALAAGAKEIKCLAWDHEMDLRLEANNLEAELCLKIGLLRIPREIMEKNRTEVPFFEIGSLVVEPVLCRSGRKATVDIKLKNFLPSLAEVPSRELDALKERAVKHGFDFIDFWAVDFDYKEGQPFKHHWQDYRTRRDRSLKTVTDFGYEYTGCGPHTACVKVIDTFGCDTSVLLEVRA